MSLGETNLIGGKIDMTDKEYIASLATIRWTEIERQNPRLDIELSDYYAEIESWRDELVWNKNLGWMAK
jgi:hypothetical protein